MAKKAPPHQQLRDLWRKKAQSLPTGGRLEFEAHPDHVWLHIIQLPPEARGGRGTRLMAELMSIADQLGMPVSLTADPTDRGIGDPGVYDLVKWYSRFGFKLYALDNDRVALMERSPGERSSTPEKVLAKYKQTPPAMTAQEFEAWEEDQFRRQGIVIEPQERELHIFSPRRSP